MQMLWSLCPAHADVESATSSQAHISEGILATAVANQTASDALDAIAMMEAKKKLKLVQHE